MLLSALLLFASAPAAEVSDCDSVARCNAQGTAAYQAGRFDEAHEIFQRQIDYADTDIETQQFADKPVEAGHQKARETALNNALLAVIKGGECLKARAYLTLTDPAASATLANAKLYQQRCAELVAKAQPSVGDYWQYVGHGSWNRTTIRKRADGRYELDAFFMRISRGPMDHYGPAAFGSHAGVQLQLRKTAGSGLPSSAEGEYEGYGENPVCMLRIHFTENGFTADGQENQDCNTGGAGANFVGEYLQVSTMASPPDESMQ